MPDVSLDGPRRISGMDVFIAVLTWFLVSSFMAIMAALFFKAIPEGNKEILVYMAGQLSGFTAAAVGLWTNTTYHSNEKTKLLAQAQPIDINK